MAVNPVAILKRKRDNHQPIDLKLCLLCQLHITEPLKAASAQGKKRVLDVAQERRRLHDIDFAPVIENLQSIPESIWSQAEIKWHKSCYSKFTAENKLERLRKRKCSEFERDGDLNLASTSDTNSQPKQRISRSSQSQIDWGLCMFCQASDTSNMRNVSTMALSEKVISLAKNDLVMRVRLAGIHDLVAAEGKYHLKCLVQFERHSNKLESESSLKGETDTVMDKLCVELLHGLAHGNVYDMGDIWQTYSNMCNKSGVQPCDSYTSRRKTFNDAVKECVGPEASFIRPLDMKASLLMYPSNKSQLLIADTLTNMSYDETLSEASDDVALGSLHKDSNILQEIVHVALQVRNDLDQTPGHLYGWGELNQTSINNVIPNSLYMFLSVLFGGVSVLETDEPADEDIDMKKKVCSIAQDIVFGVSKHRKLTPKHVGLGLTLHQATRSEQLVNLFHSAGHTISMDTIRRIDTTIATDILDKYEANGYVYIPDGIVPYMPGRIILSSCDNIDVLEETIDGKNTFHATQMVVWQRGPASKSESCFDIKRPKALERDRLAQLHELDHAHMPPGTRPSPMFETECQIKTDTWFDKSEERHKAKLLNDAWILTRMKEGEQHIPHWSEFNALISLGVPPVTTTGMLPILQAPADNNDTMTTVINKFIGISHKMGQPYTVLIGDQPLYSRAKELVWANQDLYKDVIILLGGLHILFNFLKVIGQHLENAGLVDIWIEADLFAPNSTEAMLNGKAYYRAVRGHIWTYEALSRIWWKQLAEWLDSNDDELEGNAPELASKVADLFDTTEKTHHNDIRDAFSELVSALDNADLQDQMKQFDRKCSEEANYAYWTTYMKMVETLLDFIRADREGNWELHLDAFAAMLPWMTIYDHTNYARWGPVYLAEMKGLAQTAPQVYAEFMAGNFVVKRSNKNFNQVPVDQATEWVNRMCKISNGIIGITRNDPARDRFCATWAARSNISDDTNHLFGLKDDGEGDEPSISTRKDSCPSKGKRDERAVESLIRQFERFDVFRITRRARDSDHNVEEAQANPSEGDVVIAASLDELPDVSHNQSEETLLISLTTNDVAGSDIQSDLLSAEEKGKKLVQNNTKDRLVEKTVPFFSPIKRNHSKTFGTLYKCTTVNKTNEKKTIKADRRLMQQLFNASDAGRKVEIGKILEHELSPFPLSLAKINGEMNSPTKSDLLDLLTKDFNILTPPEIPTPAVGTKTCIVIDGHALIQALGKPSNCHTFDEYADVFIKIIFGKLKGSVTRVDVVFDRYSGKESIKAPTRSKRTGKGKRPIRKHINDGDVPLPKVWAQFIMLAENKADLACFLSKRLMAHAERLRDNCEIITGGGFEDPRMTQSSKQGAMPQLQADHEEADTRIILHSCDAIESGHELVLVECRDTDVILMMIHFLGHLRAEVWMISGTARQRKCYPVNAITQQLSQQVVDNILGFHAITGSDTTSSFTGHGKKSCWKLYLKYPELLAGIGRDGPIELAEEFVCHLYDTAGSVQLVNKLRLVMFQKGQKALEMLPPTKDAFQLHVARANFQAKIWLHASVPLMDLGLPSATGGWANGSDGLDIVWTHLPSVPIACIELVSCGCRTKCKTGACRCHKAQLVCTPACACNADQCRNPVGMN